MSPSPPFPAPPDQFVGRDDPGAPRLAISPLKSQGLRPHRPSSKTTRSPKNRPPPTVRPSRSIRRAQRPRRAAPRNFPDRTAGTPPPSPLLKNHQIPPKNRPPPTARPSRSIRRARRPRRAAPRNFPDRTAGTPPPSPLLRNRRIFRRTGEEDIAPAAFHMVQTLENRYPDFQGDHCPLPHFPFPNEDKYDILIPVKRKKLRDWIKGPYRDESNRI